MKGVINYLGFNVMNLKELKEAKRQAELEIESNKGKDVVYGFGVKNPHYRLGLAKRLIKNYEGDDNE